MKKLVITILCLFINMIVNAQNFNRLVSLNCQVEVDTVLYPFDGNPVTSIGISGHVTFTSELGFVRFIVSDNHDDEYLIYESYRLFENDSSFNFSQKCEESCFYESYSPTELIVQVHDATVSVTSVNLSNTHYSNAEYQRMTAATMADNAKLSSVQNYINDNELIWMADHTKLSNLSYASKAKLWGDNYRSYGFEYYAGGFYSLFGPNNIEERSTIDYTGGYVDNFDWRNRHGANDSNSAYYDHDTDSSGWLSPLKCQMGCWENGVFSCGTISECNGEYRSVGTCWDFGPTAQVEALANLYYNEHLDLDLSEQYIACAENKMESWCPDSAFRHFQNEGVPYEECWPYTASLDNCESVCNEPIDRVSIPSYTLLQTIDNADTIRKYIIQNGPMAAKIIPSQTWTSHCMLLVGWGTIDEDSPIVSGLPNHSIPESWYGATYWIYKNSYGVSTNHNMFGGYSYLIHNHVGNGVGHTPKCYLVSLPIYVPGKTTNDINCIDNDGDGYYNWGIGPKPNHCPSCPDEPDGDDNNPSLGPLNEFGQCTIIDTYSASFETGWDNWVQDEYLNGTTDYDWWRHAGPTGHGNTGPQSAQDGDYYIYANGSFPSMTSDFISVASPPIDLRQSGACKCMLDFFYHMKSSNYGNPEYNKLYIRIKRHGYNTWITQEIAKHNQGDEWKHKTVLLPIDTEQIKFYATKGENACDVALDNITIGPWYHVETPIEIDDNVVWENKKQINQDIIIQNGGCLTIRKTGNTNLSIELHPDSRIIVKPGGRLILDGCKVTSSCSNEMWQGIEVWGNTNTHQYEINGSYGQGYVEMRNGATIENAVCALDLWRPNHWNTTGGIVHAQDAVFRNNQLSVHALHYKNLVPTNGMEADYNAGFTRCRFVVNENYIGAENQTFHKHVDLSHVRGIKFQACDFSVTTIPTDNVSLWTSGIAGYEAGFSVSGLCSDNVLPCPSFDNSTFSGFFTAINAANDGSKTPPAISVTHTSFTNNDFGIYASNLSNTTVLFCDFDVKRQDYKICGAGIYAEYLYGFVIEENSFTKTNTFNGNGYGIIVKDAGCQSSIYHNRFDGLYCGNLSWGKNILGKSSNNYIGLEYGCNANIGNAIDFYVLKEDGIFSGIQSSQGSDLVATRNTFSRDGYHFYNGGDHRISYYYYDVTGYDDEEPQTYNSAKFTPIGTNQTNNCPMNYVEDLVSLVLTSTKRQQLEQEYYDAYTAYNSLKSVYDSRIDGGNTYDMMGDIVTATPSDMWTLRAQLLGFSPYLSGEVLRITSDRDDVFTESVLFEILLSNPDELKKDSLMDHLRNKANPLPQYMLDILDQIANGITARTLIQNQMAAYRRTYSRAASDIIRSILNDTTFNLTELRGWLSNLEDIHADRDIIATYVGEGDFTSALTLANMLPNLYGLIGTDLTEHNNYVELIELYRDIYSDGRNTLQMNSTERSRVEQIANYGSGYSQAIAKAILDEADGKIYAEGIFDCPTLTLPEDFTGRNYTFTQEDFSHALGMNVTIKPNPATTWTAVNYTLPMKMAKATMTITNILGTIVMKSELYGNQSQKVIDLRGLASGVYVYTVRCGELSQTGKLVITN